MDRNPVIYVVIVFVGILGVIGSFQDFALLADRPAWELDQLYGKYLSAAFGATGFALTLVVARRRNNKSAAPPPNDPES